MKCIEDSTNVRVRFSESDAMGVVWHGNYLKYFEDGRESLGKKFKMTYQNMYKKGFVIPIVNVKLNYKSPIHFGEEMKVITRLVFTPAAKVVHQYEVWNLSSGKLSCEGHTEQVFLNENTRSLELFTPSFYAEWLNSLSWKEK
jgi:acyl-CoA thioester hydrolase